MEISCPLIFRTIKNGCCNEKLLTGHRVVISVEKNKNLNVNVAERKVPDERVLLLSAQHNLTQCGAY